MIGSASRLIFGCSSNPFLLFFIASLTFIPYVRALSHVFFLHIPIRTFIFIGILGIQKLLSLLPLFLYSSTSNYLLPIRIPYLNPLFGWSLLRLFLLLCYFVFDLTVSSFFPPKRYLVPASSVYDPSVSLENRLE